MAFLFGHDRSKTLAAPKLKLHTIVIDELGEQPTSRV